jgi:hypothetical protein
VALRGGLAAKARSTLADAVDGERLSSIGTPGSLAEIDGALAARWDARSRLVGRPTLALQVGVGGEIDPPCRPLRAADERVPDAATDRGNPLSII